MLVFSTPLVNWRPSTFSPVHLPPPLPCVNKYRAGIFKPSMGARNRRGIELSYLPARGRICKRLWSPGIDSEEPIPPAYAAWQAGTTNRVVVPARPAGN
jgi:hypothetical protein